MARQGPAAQVAVQRARAHHPRRAVNGRVAARRTAPARARPLAAGRALPVSCISRVACGRV